MNSSSPDTILVTPSTTPNETPALSFPYSANVYPTQAGGLLSFSSTSSATVTARFGVSFHSSDQACTNAEEEVPDWNWDSVQGASKAMWEDVLGRVVIDTEKENPTVVELLYSSVSRRKGGFFFREGGLTYVLWWWWKLYRASLVPANLTDENPYWVSQYPFFDAFFWWVCCSFRCCRCAWRLI